MSQKPEGFLCAEGLSSLLSHWFPIESNHQVLWIQKPKPSEPRQTGIVWTSQFTLLQNLHGNFFCEGYLSATKSTRINWLISNRYSKTWQNVIVFLLFGSHLAVRHKGRRKNHHLLSRYNFHLLTSFPSQGFYLPYSKYSWSGTAATEKIAQLP